MSKNKTILFQLTLTVAATSNISFIYAYRVSHFAYVNLWLCGWAIRFHGTHENIHHHSGCRQTCSKTTLSWYDNGYLEICIFQYCRSVYFSLDLVVCHKIFGDAKRIYEVSYTNVDRALRHLVLVNNEF